jgi:hypothetical protein
MEHSPFSEADSRSASKEISRLLWNLKVQNRAHKSLPLVHTLSHMHPVDTCPPHFFKIQYNIAFPYKPRFPQVVSSFPSQTKILYAFMIFPMRSTWTKNIKS